jgi:hypothetical protein
MGVPGVQARRLRYGRLALLCPDAVTTSAALSGLPTFFPRFSPCARAKCNAAKFETLNSFHPKAAVCSVFAYKEDCKFLHRLVSP